VIKNKEKRSGFTLHRVTDRIDSGDILFQKDIPIDMITDPAELDTAIAESAVQTLHQYMDHLRTNSTWTKVTVEAGSVYVKRVDYLSFPAGSLSNFP
jgi:methionyl-tRNA formyltransferase